MRGRGPLGRISLVIIAAVAAGLTGLGPAAATVATSAGASTPGHGTATAAACRGWKVVPAPSPAGFTVLRGVAVVPRSSGAWAAGESNPDANTMEAFLLHWNGTRWRQVASPNPNPSGSTLHAVAAVSATDAWAAGYYADPHILGVNRTLILHWNGTRWRQVPSPTPTPAGRRRSGGSLSGVAAVSRRNAWAVGTSENFRVTPFDRTLILHWNGKAWKQVPSPNPDASSNELDAVAAVSATDAWAVGTTNNGPTLILHWNGKKWKRVPSPNPPPTSLGDQNVLTGVAAISARSAWAVGTEEEFTNQGGNNTDPIMEHWNGKRWRLVASPDPLPQSTELDGVSAVSATDAWAVGSTGGSRPIFIEHWNGSTWTQVSTPSVAGGGDLLGVAASPTRRFVWAVGLDVAAGTALTLHHC